MNEKTESCPSCDGHGIVSDYGPFGNDFYGPKECDQCDGSGVITDSERVQALLEAAAIAYSYREQWSSANGFGGHSAAARIIGDTLTELAERAREQQ